MPVNNEADGKLQPKMFQEDIDEESFELIYDDVIH